MCIFESLFAPKISESVFLDPTDLPRRNAVEEPSQSQEVHIKPQKKLSKIKRISSTGNSKLSNQRSSTSEPKKVLVLLEPNVANKKFSSIQQFPSSTTNLKIFKNHESFLEEPNNRSSANQLTSEEQSIKTKGKFTLHDLNCYTNPQ